MSADNQVSISPKLRRNWQTIVAQAAYIAAVYDTNLTLRQLFYRLVADEILPNTRPAYQTLSKACAEAQGQGNFPSLMDRTRQVHRFQTFTGPEAARSWLPQVYCRDRTEGQDVSIYLGVEKVGIVELLESWFVNLGIPILVLGGKASPAYVDMIRKDVDEQARPGVLIFAGDFDPSGEEVDHDFLERTACFDEVVRVAITAEQMDVYELPERMSRNSDSRAQRFVRKHRSRVYVELDALPPDLLRSHYQEAIASYWSDSAFAAVVAQERDEVASLGQAS